MACPKNACIRCVTLGTHQDSGNLKRLSVIHGESALNSVGVTQGIISRWGVVLGVSLRRDLPRLFPEAWFCAAARAPRYRPMLHAPEKGVYRESKLALNIPGKKSRTARFDNTPSD